MISSNLINLASKKQLKGMLCIATVFVFFIVIFLIFAFTSSRRKYSAVTNYRNGQFQRSFSPLLGNNTLSDATIKYLYEAEENLLKEATPLVSAVETINGQLRAMAMDELVIDDGNADNSTNPFDSMPWVNRKEKKAKAMLSKELTMKTSLLAKLEADFYTQCLTAIVGEPSIAVVNQRVVTEF